MVFQNINHYLNVLESKEEISVEQVLGGFQEICRDVTRAGKNVAYREIEDMPAFLELLFWLGHLYCRLYEKKESRISAYDEAKDMRELYEEIQKSQDRLNQIKGHIQAAKEEKERLTSIVSETEDSETELLREIKQLESQCALLEEQIKEEARQKEEAEKKGVLLRERFEELKADAVLAFDDAESLRKNNEQFRNNQLARAQEDFRLAQQQELEQKQRLQELTENRDAAFARIKELKLKKEEVEGQIYSAEYGCEQTKKKLEKLQARYQSIMDEKQRKEQEAVSLEERCREMEGKKAEAESQNRLMEEKNGELEEETRALEEAIAQNTDRNKSLLQMVESRKEDERKLKEETVACQNEIELLRKKLDELDRERESFQTEQEKMSERLEELNKIFNPTILKETEKKLKNEKARVASMARQLDGILEVAGAIGHRAEDLSSFEDTDKIRQALAGIDRKIDELAKEIKSYEKNIEESLA